MAYMTTAECQETGSCFLQKMGKLLKLEQKILRIKSIQSNQIVQSNQKMIEVVPFIRFKPYLQKFKLSYKSTRDLAQSWSMKVFKIN